MTLTARPVPICTPLLTRPTLTPWDGTVDRSTGGPLVIPTDTPTTGCVDGAELVADTSMPEVATVNPGESFANTWRMRNTGTCPWVPGYVPPACLRGSIGGCLQRSVARCTIGRHRRHHGSTVRTSASRSVPGNVAAGEWQPESRSVTFSLCRFRVAPAAQPVAPISFWVEAPQVSAGTCTLLHWERRCHT